MACWNILYFGFYPHLSHVVQWRYSETYEEISKMLEQVRKGKELPELIKMPPKKKAIELSSINHDNSRGQLRLRSV